MILKKINSKKKPDDFKKKLIHEYLLKEIQIEMKIIN